MNETVSLPSYVCCAVTEGAWTWFGAVLFIAVLVTIATVRYCWKSIQRPKHLLGREDLLVRSVLADDHEAASKIRTGPVELEEFSSYYAERSKHPIVDRLELNKAYRSLMKHTQLVGNRPENVSKNNDPKIIPYDYNRVKLKVEKERVSDYINASYVQDPTDYTKWIVSQGPMNYLYDFWSMIWNERILVIIMLTRTFELTKIICLQYWPNKVGSTEKYGSFLVTLDKEENFATYMIRTLTVTRQNDPETSRTIRHYHYFEWPMYGMTHTSALLQFIRHVWIDLDNDTKNPLVHCHDGGRRCGMFLAVVFNIKLARKYGHINVYQSVQELLRCRKSMIITPENYQFIYTALEEYIVCGITAIPISEKKLWKIESESFYKSEYTRLCSLQPRFTRGDCAAAHMQENRKKHRNVMIVPPDDHRPYLRSFQGNDSGDFINAVFIDGFKHKKSFIVTEWPMTDTIGNFWSMVYDHNISGIVVFNNPKINKSFPRFWPEKGYQQYGVTFGVELAQCSCQSAENISCSKLIVHKKEMAPHREVENFRLYDLPNKIKFTEAPQKIVQLYQIRNWPEESKRIPIPTFTDLISLTRDLQKHGNLGGTIVALSNDGYSRCGVFLASSICVERLDYWNEVDVFQAVKSIRRVRPQLIVDKVEYKAVYDVIHDYILKYEQDYE